MKGALQLPWLPALREFPGCGTGRSPGGAQGGPRVEEEELKFQETLGALSSPDTEPRGESYPERELWRIQKGLPSNVGTI